MPGQSHNPERPWPCNLLNRPADCYCGRQGECGVSVCISNSASVWFGVTLDQGKLSRLVWVCECVPGPQTHAISLPSGTSADVLIPV